MAKTICNVTFMLLREDEEKFIAWLSGKKETLTAGAPGMDFPEAPRLTSMRMAGGVDYRQAEAQSVAFQQEFPSAESARAWSEKILPEVASEFEARFAPHAMLFTSLFEIIPF